MLYAKILITVTIVLLVIIIGDIMLVKNNENITITINPIEHRIDIEHTFVERELKREFEELNIENFGQDEIRHIINDYE